MSNTVEMPKYLCHKQVWALKIKSIDPLEGINDRVLITPEEKGYSPFVIDIDYVYKHLPVIGGYYVVYEDGYTSYSPAEAFESGYSLI